MAVDTLHVAVWTPEQLPDEIVVSRFMLPVRAQDILLEWCREKTKRTFDMPVSVVTGGLPEIAAFLAPETAYIKPDRDAGGPLRLSFFFLEPDIVNRDGLRQRIRASISIWLGIVYPKKPADMRGDIAATVEDDANWTLLPIKTGLRVHTGTCAAPIDNRLFDALTAYIVRRLAGKRVQFTTGQDRTMVLQTPHSSLFGGIELVAFPPNRGRDGVGLWSEVVTLSTATFPERKEKGLHVLARPSIRNWGPVRGYDTWTSPSRSLDVFTPDGGTGNSGFARYRHASFRYKAKVENWSDVIHKKADKNIVARWESQEDHRVFDLVGRLTGANRLANADLTQIIVGDEGRWVLPRLAPGSGDRYLSGASGVGWPDRKDIAIAIDEYLKPAGFARTEPLTRLQGRMPIKGPFNSVPAADRDEAKQHRRAAVMKALNAVGARNRQLDIIVFRIQDNTPQSLTQEIRGYLGTPDREEGPSLFWHDGLRINVIPAVSGPLAQALPKVQLAESETAGKTDKQQLEIRRAKLDDAKQQVAEDMRRHIRAARQGNTDIGCAILEMPESHRRGGETDPYAVARSELASERLLPQVVLVDDEDEQDAENPKMRAALRDLLRMLGVLPAFEERLPYAVAAIGVIQRNAQLVGGGRIQSQAFPLAVRVKDGAVECALSEDNGEPQWLPYAEAALFIFSGVSAKFRRTRLDENVAKFHTFFNSVLEQINRSGDTVVLADMETLADKWIPSIQNGRLTFDRLEVGARVYGPADLPNIRLIRLSAASNKLPSYYVEDETQWPTGLFVWGDDARRTGYALKRKPVSAKTVGRSMPISRHLPVGDNRAVDDRPRKISAVDEVCVAFCQDGDDLTDLRLMAHRLRSVHAQYDDDTVSPFPLHELLLLGKAVTA